MQRQMATTRTTPVSSNKSEQVRTMLKSVLSSSLASYQSSSHPAPTRVSSTWYLHPRPIRRGIPQTTDKARLSRQMAQSLPPATHPCNLIPAPTRVTQYRCSHRMRLKTLWTSEQARARMTPASPPSHAIRRNSLSTALTRVNQVHHPCRSSTTILLPHLNNLQRHQRPATPHVHHRRKSPHLRISLEQDHSLLNKTFWRFAALNPRILSETSGSIPFACLLMSPDGQTRSLSLRSSALCLRLLRT